MLVECHPPGFRANDTDLWRENMPDTVMKDSSLVAADPEISKLEQSKNNAQFQADSLAFARDAAQVAVMFQKTQQSERSARLARVMHLKQENSIGGTIIVQHMDRNCRHVGGPLTTLQPAMDEAWITSTATLQHPKQVNKTYVRFHHVTHKFSVHL